MAPKRKHVVLSLNKKSDALDQLQKRENAVKLVQDIGVGSVMLSD